MSAPIPKPRSRCGSSEPSRLEPSRRRSYPEWRFPPPWRRSSRVPSRCELAAPGVSADSRPRCRARSSRLPPSCAGAEPWPVPSTVSLGATAPSPTTFVACTCGRGSASASATRSRGGRPSTMCSACAPRPVRWPSPPPSADVQPTRSTGLRRRFVIGSMRRPKRARSRRSPACRQWSSVPRRSATSRSPA